MGTVFLLPLYDLVPGNALEALGEVKLDEEVSFAKCCLAEDVFGFEGLSISEEEVCSVNNPLAEKVGAPDIRDLEGSRELEGDRHEKSLPLC